MDERAVTTTKDQVIPGTDRRLLVTTAGSDDELPGTPCVCSNGGGPAGGGFPCGGGTTHVLSIVGW